MEKQFYCIDEQTKISGILIELNCKKMVHNYEKTEQQLDAILEGSKGRIILTMGGKILINTMDEKKLAETIIENVRHYFGDSINKPKNTADEALIIKRADDWLSGKKRKRDTDKTPQQYADFVVERAKRDFATDTDRAERGDTATTFKEIINAVEQWAEMKRKQSVDAQQLPDQLNTDEAKQYFEKAIGLGLMDNCYRWKKGLQMLSCFAREMSLKLNLNKSTNSDGTKRISWKPFEILFGIEKGKLRSNYNDIQKTGQSPYESDLIDKIFE